MASSNRGRHDEEASPSRASIDDQTEIDFLTLNDLVSLYSPPSAKMLARSITSIDRHAAQFISLSPFCLLASVGADGAGDVSPRGGSAGFVKIGRSGAL
jgi:hypothetical protein